MNISQYIKDATSKIFMPKAKEEVSLELTDHILNKQKYWEDIGYESEISEGKAVEEMGDSVDIADYLASIHNDFYSPAFELIWFIIFAIISIGSYFVMKKFIFNDASAVPIIIGFVFALFGIYFGINAINAKRNRKFPIVLSFITGIIVCVISFFSNIQIMSSGINSISQLINLMFKGEFSNAQPTSLIPPAIICIIIFVISAIILSIGLFFVIKFEKQENTLKTNKSKKLFSKALAILCVSTIAIGLLFASDIFLIQTKIEEQYQADYSLMFEIAEKCESKQDINKYLKANNITPKQNNSNKIIIEANTSDIIIDFSEEKTKEPNDAFEKLFANILTGLINKTFPETLEKQYGYIIRYDMSEKFNKDNGFENGYDSLGLTKIKTYPQDLDNLFNFETKKETTNEELIEAFGMYYPKKLTIYASDNHSKHFTNVSFDYTAGSYQNAFVQTFDETLISENEKTVNNQKKETLKILNENPNISDKELSEKLNTKHKKPAISYTEYKSIISQLASHNKKLSDNEIEQGYSSLNTHNFSDDLFFIRVKIENGDYILDLPADKMLNYVVFISLTNARYISFDLYGEEAKITDQKYYSQYMGTFRKTRYSDVGYYDRNGNAYISPQDVAYYSKSGERFRYYIETDDEGKQIEQYFIGSNGSKSIANESFVDENGYFVCGNDDIKKAYDISGSIDTYRDSSGMTYQKAVEVSWDSNGNLLDFDKYFDIVRD